VWRPGRRTVRTTIVTLLAALTLAACSGDDDGAADDPEPPATTAAPSTPEPLPDEDDGDPDAADDTEEEGADDGTDDGSAPADAEEATVEVFFTNADRGADPEVFPVERTVALPAVLRGALEALLAGPTPDEEADGYRSFFSSETADQLDDVTIEDGVAEVSFSSELPELIPNASTSAGSTSLLAALDATTTQFDTVDEAVYSLEGDVDAFYEWLQRVAPA
jgi:spore germination protein GerM